MPQVSEDCLRALLWLRNRNGDGVFDRNQVLIAACESAPVMRSTWNKLETAELVEFYLDRRRIRVTEAGRALNLSKLRESA